MLYSKKIRILIFFERHIALFLVGSLIAGALLNAIFLKIAAEKAFDYPLLMRYAYTILIAIILCAIFLTFSIKHSLKALANPLFGILFWGIILSLLEQNMVKNKVFSLASGAFFILAASLLNTINIYLSKPRQSNNQTIRRGALWLLALFPSLYYYLHLDYGPQKYFLATQTDNLILLSISVASALAAALLAKFILSVSKKKNLKRRVSASLRRLAHASLIFSLFIYGLTLPSSFWVYRLYLATATVAFILGLIFFVLAPIAALLFGMFLFFKALKQPLPQYNFNLGLSFYFEAALLAPLISCLFNLTSNLGLMLILPIVILEVVGLSLMGSASQTLKDDTVLNESLN